MKAQPQQGGGPVVDTQRATAWEQDQAQGQDRAARTGPDGWGSGPWRRAPDPGSCAQHAVSGGEAASEEHGG